MLHGQFVLSLHEAKGYVIFHQIFSLPFVLILLNPEAAYIFVSCVSCCQDASGFLATRLKFKL